MDQQKTKKRRQLRRRRHVRSKIVGTAERPRLTVNRTSKHIYAQLIDDTNGLTLLAVSSRDKSIDAKGTNTEVATAVGKAVAEKALQAGIENVTFDRGGYLYHGRVKSLAEGAREAGLKF